MKFSGTVKWFNMDKGYGFIVPDGGGKDVFVHVSDIKASSMTELREEQRVSFDTRINKGRTAACDLKIV